MRVFLTYAGLIPFLACSILIFLGVNNVPLLGSVFDIQKTYMLIIAAFMAGIHWGQALGNNKDDYKLYIISNIHAIALFFLSILAGQQVFSIGVITIFTSILYVDHRLLKQNIISQDYFKMRFVVSIIVITSIIVSLI